MAPLPGMVSSNLCMPYWIRDQEGRLVRIENPQDTELDICVNIMDPPPEDQNSQQGQGGNPNAYLSMRDRMHPPRMSAPSCILLLLSSGYKAPYCAPSTKFPWNGEYMEAINACPHHGFDTWLLVSYFYDGMSSSMKQILETMCGGDFMSKNPEEAMDFLSYVSEVSRGWDEPNSREKGKFPSQPTQNPKGGMYVLSEDMDMKAKVATIARRLEELELKKMHEVQAISETQAHVMPCTICQSCDHVVDECPTMPAVREMLGDQANVVGQFRPNNNAPYGNTYNSSWRNHPNFSWKPRPPPYQPQAQTQAPQQTSSVEQAIVNLSKVMGDFVGEQKAINSQLHQKIENVESSQIKRMEGMQNDLSQKIDNIQYSISRLTNLNTVNEKGKFPSQPSQNPKGVHEVETQEGESSKLREVKAVITLRSGKEVDQPLPKVSKMKNSCQRKPWLKRAITKKRRVGRKVHPNQALKKSQG
ncbi:hypothetical protein CK203_063492 [Vitis vinifera]|uniref:Retrotransposon gag domain-containing protein n=1 Tax=Vitis vinifera TaxID=29760 RepID=A0A438G6X9_VITVI|nr:hypothetical protein CK203_063492 [Vitis vinifera]